MRVFESGRRTGKTQRMVDWLRHKNDGVLIVMSEAERRRILMEFFTEQERPKYEDRIQAAIGYNKLHGRRDTVLGIDNLDLVLSGLLGHPVDVATITNHD